MNAVDPRRLNGEDPNRKGPYAFVGRVGETAPPVEASSSLNGVPGRLRGVLMRARDGGYEPMLAGPPRSDGESRVNTELIDIANQAPQPFPAFTDANGQPIDDASAKAVQKFLGVATGLCSAAADAPECDIRESYYQGYRDDWSAITGKLQTQSCPDGPGFTTAQCNGIRRQLSDEAFDVAKVTRYFGPLGLQQPFGTASVGALANLTEISQTIRDAVNPPPADNTTSNNLAMIGQILFPTPTTPYPSVFSSLSAAFSLTAYFTKEDASPNLIGPQVTTAASKLGVELADRYQQAGDHLDDLGRLIVSDYGKLTAVASKVDAQPGPGGFDWRLGNVGQSRDELIRAAKQTIYQRLVSLAYPVMYDLGQADPASGGGSVEQIDNARNWYCQGGLFSVNKYLFADQADGAQFVARFPAALSNPDAGSATTYWAPLIAVAQVHATGHVHDARIPGIPSTITDELFNPVDQGGLGLNKLEFYSPRNGFRYLPSDPNPTGDDYSELTLHFYPDPNKVTGNPADLLDCSSIPDPPDNSG